jgi:hypothetical protein
MHNFAALTRDEQADAIRQLAASGLGDYALAHATGLAVEQVRVILGDRPTTAATTAADRGGPRGTPTVVPIRRSFAPERTRSERG